MKKTIQTIAIILGVLFILFAAALYFDILGIDYRNVGWYADYVNDNYGLLIQIAEGTISPDESIWARWILREARVEMIYPGEQGVHFSLGTDNAEHNSYMLYCPGGEYIFEDADNAWIPVETQDGSLRWEGGGITGQGYWQVDRLSEDFFLVENWIPT